MEKKLKTQQYEYHYLKYSLVHNSKRTIDHGLNQVLVVMAPRRVSSPIFDMPR